MSGGRDQILAPVPLEATLPGWAGRKPSGIPSAAVARNRVASVSSGFPPRPNLGGDPASSATFATDLTAPTAHLFHAPPQVLLHATSSTSLCSLVEKLLAPPCSDEIACAEGVHLHGRANLRIRENLEPAVIADHSVPELEDH